MMRHSRAPMSMYRFDAIWASVAVVGNLIGWSLVLYYFHIPWWLW